MYDLIMLYMTTFFFNYPATSEIYALSLHDALPIFSKLNASVILSFLWLVLQKGFRRYVPVRFLKFGMVDRKSTRLNSSHVKISYAVFCLKKKRFYSLLYNFRVN